MSDEFRCFVASDRKKFSKVIQEAKIKPDGWVDMTIWTEQRLGRAEHISAPPLVRHYDLFCRLRIPT
jgi:hypothetical protein